MNTPFCSSAGWFFDAIAALCALCRYNDYEGQAATALEFAATSAPTAPVSTPFSWEITPGSSIDWTPLLRHILTTLSSPATDPRLVARHFHLALADLIASVAHTAGLPRVVLTGGCFQNALLTELATARLRAAGHEPLLHRLVPPNDGGLALGQAVIASRLLCAETP